MEFRMQKISAQVFRFVVLRKCRTQRLQAAHARSASGGAQDSRYPLTPVSWREWRSSPLCSPLQAPVTNTANRPKNLTS